MFTELSGNGKRHSFYNCECGYKGPHIKGHDCEMDHEEVGECIYVNTACFMGMFDDMEDLKESIQDSLDTVSEIEEEGWEMYHSYGGSDELLLYRITEDDGDVGQVPKPRNLEVEKETIHFEARDVGAYYAYIDSILQSDHYGGDDVLFVHDKDHECRVLVFFKGAYDADKSLSHDSRCVIKAIAGDNHRHVHGEPHIVVDCDGDYDILQRITSGIRSYVKTQDRSDLYREDREEDGSR